MENRRTREDLNARYIARLQKDAEEGKALLAKHPNQDIGVMEMKWILKEAQTGDILAATSDPFSAGYARGARMAAAETKTARSAIRAAYDVTMADATGNLDSGDDLALLCGELRGLAKAAALLGDRRLLTKLDADLATITAGKTA